MNKFDTTITLAALAAALAVPILAAAGSVPAALAAGSCSTFALLGLSHVAFWPSRDKMHRPIAYAIGVSCIGAGMLLFSILTQLYIVVIAFVGIALPGGLLIAAAWWLRPTVSLDEGRRMIADAITTYLADPLPSSMLLIAAPAGIGKTTFGVETAERAAAGGDRVLYVGPRKEFFDAAGVMPADRLARRAEESRAALRELDTRRN